MKPTLPTLARLVTLAFVSSLAFAMWACTAPRAAHASANAASADEHEIRLARAAQNKAIASGNVDSIADFWTDDVEIRRGLGQLVVGRGAYRQLFVASGAADSALVYQREPSIVTVSSTWPLAYESGVWAGHLGSTNGPPIIGGSYAAQWVKREGRWLIRGEVYVALTCAAQGCRYASAP